MFQRLARLLSLRALVTLIVTLMVFASLVTAGARRGLAQTLPPDSGKADREAEPVNPALGPAGVGASGTAWEDMLLLQAIRYLRLSPAQLQQLLPVARAANRQLTSLQAREDKVLESLRQTAVRQRDALAAGQQPSLQQQADAIALRESTQRVRSDTENSIVGTSLPALARVLTPKQSERAFLLSQGLTPESEAREPALLDPPAGFVTGSFGEGPMIGFGGPGGPMGGFVGPGGAGARLGAAGNKPNLAQQLLQAQARLSMLQRDLSSGPRPPGAVGVAVFRANDGEPPQVFQFGDPAGAPPLPGLPPGAKVMDEAAFRQHLADEARTASTQVNDLRRQLFDPAEGLPADQYETLLRPLARRLFLSSRFQQALEKRLNVQE